MTQVVLLGVHFVALLLYKTNYHWSTLIVGVASPVVLAVMIFVRLKLNRFIAAVGCSAGTRGSAVES